MKNEHKVKLLSAGADAETATLFRERVDGRKIGRNDMCPCGSGKKAKNCCGTNAVYTYKKHINYVVKESDVREDLRFVRRNDSKGGLVTKSRWCYRKEQLVVVNGNCKDKSLVEKKARVVERGLCHDFLRPYYIVNFDDSDNPFERWINEEYLSPIII